MTENPGISAISEVQVVVLSLILDFCTRENLTNLSGERIKGMGILVFENLCKAITDFLLEAAEKVSD